MIALWRYFFRGLNYIGKPVVAMYLGAGLLSVTLAFMSRPWWIWGPLAIFVWVFMAPFTI